MIQKTIKILTAVLVISLLVLKCSDDNIINTYNRLTEHYRSTPEDRLDSPDSCITVRVLGSQTDRPMVNTRIVLTNPAGDTVSAATDKEGFAVFKLITKTEGTYTVKASLFENGIEYSRKNSYYLYEKNNSTLTIYINENAFY